MAEVGSETGGETLSGILFNRFAGTCVAGSESYPKRIINKLDRNGDPVLGCASVLAISVLGRMIARNLNEVFADKTPCSISRTL
jgi:hypothetical protein